MSKIYQDKVVVPGSASNQTIKLVKIPEGFQLFTRHFAAAIYTTNPGDYTTAKFIWLGYEHNGVKFYVEGHDVQPGAGKNCAVVFAKNFYIPENAEPFAYVEATSTSQKIEVMINGDLQKLPEQK